MYTVYPEKVGGKGVIFCALLHRNVVKIIVKNQKWNSHIELKT